jgi:hypothetical protein
VLFPGVRGLVILAVLVAVEPPFVAAAPAALEAKPADVCGLALAGPFSTRAQACEEVLGTRGSCATYHTETAVSAPHGWRAVEIGAVRDSGRAYADTKHFALFANIDGKWFATFLGTNGKEDTEYFPPCDRQGHSCTPFHRDRPLYFQVPTLSFVDAVKGGAEELVLFYRTPRDVGFRDFAPDGELVQVCGLGAAGSPSCTPQLIAVSRSQTPIKAVTQLFTGNDEVTPYNDEVDADGRYHPYVGHLRF